MFAVALSSHSSITPFSLSDALVSSTLQSSSSSSGLIPQVKYLHLCPDGWAEGVFEAPGSVSWLWCLKGLPEGSGSAVWRLQGRAAGSRGQSLMHRLIGNNTYVSKNKISAMEKKTDVKRHLNILLALFMYETTDLRSVRGSSEHVLVSLSLCHSAGW